MSETIHETNVDIERIDALPRETKELAGADFMARLREVLATRTERSKEDLRAAFAGVPETIGGEDITPDDED